MSSKPIYEHTMTDRTPYVYLLKNKTAGLFYYGLRFGKNCHPDDFWVEYFTSSKLVKDLINKHGKSDFDFEIRKTFDSKEAAIDWEQRVIRRLAKNSPIFLNLDDSQQPHLTIQSKHKTKFISDPVTGVCRRIQENMEIPNGWVVGNLTPRKQSEKVSDRKWYYESDTLKLHHCNPSKADPSWIEGRPGCSNSTSMKKRELMHITNGIENKLINKNDAIPEGWVKGRTKSEEDRRNNAAANKKFIGWKEITDGKTIKRIPPDQPLPDGFIFGKIPTSELNGDANWPAKIAKIANNTAKRNSMLKQYELREKRKEKELQRVSKLKRIYIINEITKETKIILPNEEIPIGYSLRPRKPKAG